MVKQKRTGAPLGASLIVLSSLFYASYGIWVTLIGNFLGSFTASALRCAAVFGLLIVIAVVRKELQKIYWRRDIKWILIMIVSSILVSGPLYYAVVVAGVSVSLAIGYIGIVIGMFIFGWLFSGEQFTKDKLVATVLGIIGIALVFSPSVKLVGWLALVAALVSGLATAANMATTKKVPYNGSQSAILVWGTGLVNIPMAFLLHEHLPTGGWHIEWFYLLCFVLASVIASWTFIRGLKLIEAGAAGILGLLEVVFGVLIGMVFFGERPGVVVFLGVLFILAAAAIPYIKDYNAKRGTLEQSA